ncbi:IclR family transcriptional regulator [Dactylosporangium sp. NPDC049525]|uniref:IclR family transcriptional regulator n=1 Tax=Dactylosporangium sp. NPDC049525 TaxID=3154730 RepID=UPI00343ACF10
MLSAAGKDDPYALASVDNALRLLILLNERPQLRLSDAARELDIANSTAHRLLTTLVNRGFAVQDRSRAYRRGPMLPPLAPPLPFDSIREIVHGVLAALSARIDETCHFAVLEGNSVRFVDCAESGQILRIASRIGMLLPAHTTAVGKALLSRLSEPDLRQLYPRGATSPSGRGGKDLASLKRDLATTRRRGFAVNTDESAQGVSAVGRQVTGPDGASIGAMAIAVPSVRWNRVQVARWAPQLEESVTRLEGLLRRP